VGKQIHSESKAKCAPADTPNTTMLSPSTFPFPLFSKILGNSLLSLCIFNILHLPYQKITFGKELVVY
jgi:hypothetical protein